MQRVSWKDLKNKRKFLSLDKNENFDFTLREKLHKFFVTLSPEDICLYPDVAKGYECLSNYTDINSDNLILSHGSEQSLKLIFETLHRIYKCRSITICHPTFEMVDVYSRLYDFNITHRCYTFNKQFNINVDIENEDVVYISNPNCPTGLTVPSDKIEQLCLHNKWVIVDEAYVEFSRANSCCDLIRKHANLLIVRTLSKSAAAAGIRVGYIITNECNVDMFNTYKPAYEISQIAVKYIEFIANNDILIRDTIGRLQLYRRHLNKVFNGIPGDGNFIIVPYSDELYKYLDRAIDMKIVTVDDCDFIRFAVTDYDL